MADSFSDAQRRELQRMVEGLRSLMTASVAFDAPLQTLSTLADEVESLAGRVGELAGERPFARFNAPVAGDLNTILPWSPISGRYHPMAAPVVMTAEDGKLVGRARFGLPFEGPPDGVHGAIVAGVYDQVLAFAAMINGTPGHTATLTTKFRAITPLHEELRFEGWVERTDGRKIFTRGSCHAGDKLLSEAEAMFILFEPGQGGTKK
jgi:acyl-coenzyme A thioesterase PaaI-like protein